MSEQLWRMMKCLTCKSTHPSLVIVRWRFDKDLTLHFLLICRICFQKAEVSHTRDEQLADSREAYANWLTDQTDPMSTDFLIWENQMLEDRQLEEGEEDAGSD